jgi:complement component 1 Q subcomponent-binding protein, mitochondrial
MILCQGDNSGALTVDAMCQDGAFVADNISFYQDAKLATELTPEADWKRRGLYIGPQVRCVIICDEDIGLTGMTV